MMKWSRRSLIGMSFAGLSAMALPAMAQERVRLPAGAQVLTRRIVRGLSDGEKITVERDWQISFEQQGRDIAILGRQTRVEVDAPSRIAPIADIERRRSTDGQFPILLNSRGMIIAAGNVEKEEEVASAVEAAERLIAQSTLTLSQQQRTGSYLAQLQNAGGQVLDRLPRDLFYPREPAVHDLRKVALPDGTTGEFEVQFSASARPDSGLLDRADRHIITRLQGSERMSSEHWKMRAI